MELFSEVRTWLIDEAFPFWARNGVDPATGAFVESMTLAAQDAKPGFLRTRVVARQIYAFSHGSLIGYDSGLETARRGYEFLTSNAWLGDEGGWGRLLSPTGEVIDPTPDLYDLAFVLFALAWYQRAGGGDDAADWSRRTLRFIETQMRHPSGEGFYTAKPEPGWRQQNPHMHLLEATLAQMAVDKSACWRAIADELVALFRRRFFDPQTGVLREFYDAAWTAAPGADGRRVEPGHQLEWGWILSRYGQLTGVDLSDEIRQLIDFAEAYGVDPKTHRVYDAVLDDGTPLETSSRLWTNCERIQGAVALYEVDGVDPRRVFAETANVIMRRYLRTAPAGAWIDHLSEDGAQIASKIPASSLYHLTIAFAEMLRIAPRLTTRPALSEEMARAAI
jgi:N-acylglucosamine 2-epimerase/mannose-6-phosphate isomerase